MIDRIDLNILEALYEDARTPPARIAQMMNLPVDAINERIAELERRKVIAGYPAMINWSAADQETVEALIEVRISPQRGEGFDAIAEQIYNFDEVHSCFLTSGAYDLTVLVRGRSVKEVGLFVSEKLSTLEHVLSTATHFVLKRYKDDGIILEGTRRDYRMAVSP
ncbi:MAG: Lrp/AsnC family transcriptional regulator [Candidatus Excrementavichristensenella sp.]|jgi:DNA-binding Lrp family transcriptional regulator|nr:Lrp/AsnC family transcriptional regulator [Bacillota bacterium]NLL54562.1 Lrp/AsnC family transcriptional regulator [Clostridiales bacterium]